MTDDYGQLLASIEFVTAHQDEVPISHKTSGEKKRVPQSVELLGNIVVDFIVFIIPTKIVVFFVLLWFMVGTYVLRKEPSAFLQTDEFDRTCFSGVGRITKIRVYETGMDINCASCDAFLLFKEIKKVKIANKGITVKTEHNTAYIPRRSIKNEEVWKKIATLITEHIPS